jgi:hypothetical protein
VEGGSDSEARSEEDSEEEQSGGSQGEAGSDASDDSEQQSDDASSSDEEGKPASGKPAAAAAKPQQKQKQPEQQLDGPLDLSYTPPVPDSYAEFAALVGGRPAAQLQLAVQRIRVYNAAALGTNNKRKLQVNSQDLL